MILVLTTPRTGSSWFCDYIAKENHCENLGEFFGNPELSIDQQFEKLELVKNNPDVVVKCFPWHIRNVRPMFKRSNIIEKELIKIAKKIYILIRNDFNEQCKSYYLAHTSDMWEGKPMQHEDVRLDKDFYNQCVDHLKSSYYELASYYKNYDCEIVEYEHLPFGKHKRYQRPVVWLEEPTKVNFDPRDLFYPNDN